MIVDITRISTWFTDTVKPWIEIIFEENPYTKYLLILLIILIILLIYILKKKAQKGPKGGYRNFRGDVWFPDGRIRNDKAITWEEPDFKYYDKDKK
jgi:hypothetical protein